MYEVLTRTHFGPEYRKAVVDTSKAAISIAKKQPGDPTNQNVDTERPYFEQADNFYAL